MVSHINKLLNLNKKGAVWAEIQTPGAVALDLDNRYRGWQMGLTSTIAIVLAECFELVDGLIVY